MRKAIGNNGGEQKSESTSAIARGVPEVISGCEILELKESMSHLADLFAALKMEWVHPAKQPWQL